MVVMLYRSCSFGGDCGSNRGWHDNPQPASRPGFIAAQCAISLCQSHMLPCLHFHSTTEMYELLTL